MKNGEIGLYIAAVFGVFLVSGGFPLWLLIAIYALFLLVLLIRVCMTVTAPVSRVILIGFLISLILILMAQLFIVSGHRPSRSQEPLILEEYPVNNPDSED
jgi:hypothetical protein